MARACGIIAVLLAIIAIFVPIAGILVSCVAIAFAVVAALWGEFEFVIGTSAVVGINSFALSPVMFLTMMPPGQLILAAFVVFLVALPFAAMWLGAKFPAQWQRVGILLSAIWLAVVPMAMYQSAIGHNTDLFVRTQNACENQRKQQGEQAAANDTCYAQAKQVSDDAPLFRPVHFIVAAFVPIVLGWLAACGLIALQRRNGATGRA